MLEEKLNQSVIIDKSLIGIKCHHLNEHEAYLLNANFDTDFKPYILKALCFDKVCRILNLEGETGLRTKQKKGILNELLQQLISGKNPDITTFIAQKLIRYNKFYLNIKKQRKQKQASILKKQLEYQQLQVPLTELVAQEEHHNVIVNLPASKFYQTSEWRQLRYQVIKHYNSKCMACGACAKDGNQIEVDHIKPRYLYPHLALKFSNLQVLCRDCNAGKYYATDEKDWRHK